MLQRVALPPRRVRCAVTQPEDGTPLLDAVLERGRRAGDVPLHVPGHKRGRALHPGMRHLLGPDALRYDLTELAGLDYLSAPTGAIAAAQSAAAAFFGARRTWFLVNGCTVGIHAAVMAACGPGDTLLLARNCHLSAFAALVLTGARPWWVAPLVDPVHGVAHPPTPAALREALREATAAGARVKAALVVSPSYFGAAARLEEMAEACHAHGVALLVDEAHGAHFSALRRLDAAACPPGALACGADAVVQSTHKVLTAMTQAAMLHVQGDRVNGERVSQALQLLQSSSPSYLLMASLDAATAWAGQPGVWEEPLQAAQAARAGLAAIPLLQLLCPASQATPTATTTGEVDGGDAGAVEASVAGWDPLRLAVDVSAVGLTGFEAAVWLEQHHGIVPELATAQVLLFVMGPGTRMADTPRLLEACSALSAAHAGTDGAASRQQQPPPPLPPQPRPQMRLPPRDAFFSASEPVAAAAAVGRVCAELLCPYPPGVPVLFPGEAVTQAAVATLRACLTAGGVVTGAADATLQTLRVVQDK